MGTPSASYLYKAIYSLIRLLVVWGAWIYESLPLASIRRHRALRHAYEASQLSCRLLDAQLEQVVRETLHRRVVDLEAEMERLRVERRVHIYSHRS